MQINRTLTKLELSSNAVDYDGTKALAGALAENTSLTSFALRCAGSIPHPLTCLLCFYHLCFHGNELILSKC